MEKSALLTFFDSLFSTIPLHEKVIKQDKKGIKLTEGVDYYLDLRDFLSGEDNRKANKLLEDYEFKDDELIELAKKKDKDAVNAILIYCSKPILQSFYKYVIPFYKENRNLDTDDALTDFYVELREFLFSDRKTNPINYFDISLFNKDDDGAYQKAHFYLQKLSATFSFKMRDFIDYFILKIKKAKNNEISLNTPVANKDSEEDELGDLLEDTKTYYDENGISYIWDTWCALSKRLQNNPKVKDVLIALLKYPDLKLKDLCKKIGISEVTLWKRKDELREIVNDVMTPDEFSHLMRAYSPMELAQALVA